MTPVGPRTGRESARTAGGRRLSAPMFVMLACLVLATCSSGATTVVRDSGERGDDTVPESTNAGREIAGPGLRTGSEISAAAGFDRFSGLRVGLIANSASLVFDSDIAELLAADPDVELVAIYAPEHGFDLATAAGETIDGQSIHPSGAPILSLYGDARRPTAESLEGVDVLVYDLQDAGTRYFTYISTMGLAMQAAAELNLPFVVLDRPNPHGDLIAGYMRGAEVESFIAQYPIPEVYGLTPGELASAIRGEEWLPGVGDLELDVVEMEGYDGTSPWVSGAREWTAPSPSLPSGDAVLLYPALVLFEATTVSVGRGSDLPFEWIGAEWLDASALVAELERRDLPGIDFVRTELMVEVAAEEPAATTLRSIDGLRVVVTDAGSVDPVDLGVQLLQAVITSPGGDAALDRPAFLDLLAGTSLLREQLESGLSADEIIASRPPLDDYERVADRYRRYVRVP